MKVTVGVDYVRLVHIQEAHVSYSSNPRIGLDSHANTSVAGKQFLSIHEYRYPVSVSEYEP